MVALSRPRCCSDLFELIIDLFKPFWVQTEWSIESIKVYCSLARNQHSQFNQNPKSSTNTNHHKSWSLFYHDHSKKIQTRQRNPLGSKGHYPWSIQWTSPYASPHPHITSPTYHQSISPVQGPWRQPRVEHKLRGPYPWYLTKIGPDHATRGIFLKPWKSFFLRLFVAVKIGAPVLPLSRCLMPRLEPTSRPAIQSDLVD